MTEKFANNASTTLGSNISSGATTITVATGSGAEFPAITTGQWFSATLWAAGSSTGTPNEIVYVTARTGDTMTVLRGQEGTAAAAWSIGDTFANYPTAAFYNGVGTNADIQIQAGNSANDTGTASAGVITLSPVPASLAAMTLAPIRVLKTSAANTGAYTLNVNGFGAKSVTFAGSALQAGQLPASTIFEVAYDGTNFELISAPAPTLQVVYADNVVAGTYSLTVPNWATHAAVSIVGGGGGGGGGNGAGYTGGGGGAGGYVFGTVSVTPGATLTAIVGAGGTAGTSSGGTGGTGGTSSLTGVGNATGGAGGQAGTVTSAGGAGGGATASGLRAFTGGIGGDGNSASGTIPGGNGAAGPYGGQGRTGAGSGVAGTAPGAGGGGSWNSAGPGGAGAPGAVLVQWLP